MRYDRGMPKRLFDNMRLISTASWASLLSRQHHGFAVRRARTGLVTNRVRFIAALFTFLSIAWIGIDLLAFPSALALPLAGGRILAALAFATVGVMAAQKSW